MWVLWSICHVSLYHLILIPQGALWSLQLKLQAWWLWTQESLLVSSSKPHGVSRALWWWQRSWRNTTPGFLEKFSLPKLSQEEIETMNKPTINTEIKTDFKKNLSKNKSTEPVDSTGEFYQTFRDTLTPILLKLFRKITEERTLSNSFYKATITLIPKPDKDITKNKIICQYHWWT